jgi:hypothetical protein
VRADGLYLAYPTAALVTLALLILFSSMRGRVRDAPPDDVTVSSDTD